MIQAWQSFKEAQKVYAVLGAFFLPLLAVVLLILNGRSRLVGRSFRNDPVTILVLIFTLAIFVFYGWMKFT